MRHTSSSLVLALALLATSATAVVLGAGVARADPDPKLEDKTLPLSVRLEYLPDTNVRRSCSPAETLEHELALEAKREVIDPNAAARLIVRILRKGRAYTATAEVHNADGVVVYTNP